MSATFLEYSRSNFYFDSCLLVSFVGWIVVLRLSSHCYVAQASLKLEKSCLHLPSVGIPDVGYHAQLVVSVVLFCWWSALLPIDHTVASWTCLEPVAVLTSHLQAL